MLALIRKNLWLWHPARSANVVILTVAFLFSVGDAIWNWPMGAWFLATFLVLPLAQAGGTNALSIDLKHDNIRFLEYLPVRWWQVWLANCLNELAPCLVLVVVLTWHRVVFWVPPEAYAGTDVDLYRVLFATRWQPVVGLWALSYFAFSYSLVWRTFFRTDAGGIIATYLGGTVYLGLPLMGLAYLRLVPGLWDLLWVMLVLGTAFAAGSCIAFAMPPLHWSRARRFFVLGLPLLLLIFAFEVGLAYASFGLWARFDPAETGLSYVPELASGDRPALFVQARSRRSGQHTFHLDLAAGTSHYLGRDLQRCSAMSSGCQLERLAFCTSCREDGFWPMPKTVVTMRPDGTDRRSLLVYDPFVDARGQAFQIVDVQWYEPGDCWIVIGIGKSSDSPCGQAVLFLLNRNAQERKRLNLASYSSYRRASTGRILAVVSDGSGSSGRDAVTRYCLYDACKDMEISPRLPGQVFCLSGDLSQAVCRRTSSRNGSAQHALVKVHIETGQESVLINEEQMVTLAGELPEPAQDPAQPFLPHVRDSSQATGVAYGLPLLVDEGFHHAVWLAQRLDQNTRRLSLVHIDMDSGRQQVLVPESDLPTANALSDNVLYSLRLTLYGLSKSGDTFVYQLNNAVHHVRLADGSRQSVDLPSDGSYYNTSRSPSGMRLLIDYTLHDGNRPGYAREQEWVWEVIEPGRRNVVYRSLSYSTVFWLPDERLVIGDGNKVLVVNSDGTGLRQVFPVAASGGR